MQFKDLIRGAVLLVAVEATALGAISGIVINNAGDDLLAIIALAWWLIAVILGISFGSFERSAEALRDPLASAKTTTSLPSDSPASIAFARLWPLGAFALVAGGLGPLFPQIPAIATGAALLFALAWRSRERAVTAIEERDGVVFYVEKTSAFQPIKLVRTPGLTREAPGLHP